MRLPRHVPLYPMRTVVKLTGVEAHRIRFWESRYGLVTPERDESGRRLFSKEDVARISAIGAMVDKLGMSLVAVRRLVCKKTT